ncbi:MAG: hemolysin family protein [Planctomycetota bacterium]
MNGILASIAERVGLGTLETAHWVGALLYAGLAILRRSFIETPHGHYHPQFRSMRLPFDFDESEKLRRIGVMLTAVQHLTGIVWIVIFIAYRFCRGAWYDAGPWNEITWSRAFGPLIELLAFAVCFVELFPQVIAAWRGRRLVLWLLSTLCALESLFAPLTFSFRWLRAALLRFLGNGEERSDAEAAEESIVAAVEVGEREGLFEAGEKDMFYSLLKFRDAEVFEIMTPRTDMVCFDGAGTITETIPLAVACGHSRIPVYRRDIDDIIGIMNVKDLLRHASDTGAATTSIATIVRKSKNIPETKKVRELLKEFRAERFHIAIVLDEYGGTSGLVTIEDVIELIIGDIEDEYDDTATTQLIRRVDDETFDVDGRAPIVEVNLALDAELPESDDYETVAGYLMASMGKVPREGEVFQHGRVVFRIVAADERKIKRVRVQVLEPLEQDAK